jgi:hypothetical protein
MTDESMPQRSPQEDTSQGGGPVRGPGIDLSILYLIAGGVLLIVYAIVAWRMDFFLSANFHYAGNPLYIWYLPYEQLASSLWKVFLLFPASLCLAWFMSSRGYGVKLGGIYSRRSVPVIFSLAAVVLLIITVNVLLQKTEVTDDELTYDLQAKILLAGKLYVTPPVENGFNNVFILPGDKMTGKYNLGHPLVLAAGMLIGSPYVLPVLFGGLLILMIYSINMLLYKDRRQAFLSSLLLLISPFFYFTGATRLSHTTTAFSLTLFMLLFLKLRENDVGPGRGLYWSLVAGLAAGFAFNVRPLTAVGFLLPFFILVLGDIVRKRNRHLLRYLIIGAGFIAVIGFSLWYNKQITGSYVHFPFTQYDPREQLLGSRYNLAQSFSNLAVNAVKMNSFLFGFPLSLFFIFIYAFQREKSASDKLVFGILGSFCFFYLSYYGPGVSDTGPLYYYELLVPIIILSARGILWLHDWLRTSAPKWRTYAGNFLLISVLISVPTFWLERSLYLINLTNAVAEPYRAIRESQVHNALVFIQSWPNKGFVFGFRNNSPDFTDDVILCRLQKGEDNLKVMARFPTRRPYVLRYNAAAERTELSETSVEELGRIQ